MRSVLALFTEIRSLSRRFQFLLLFVTATIPTGIISKSTFGLTVTSGGH